MRKCQLLLPVYPPVRRKLEQDICLHFHLNFLIELKLFNLCGLPITPFTRYKQKVGFDYASAFGLYTLLGFNSIQLWQILAGLLDQYTIAGNPQALKMVTWMVDYFYNRVLNVITKYTVNRHYQSQNEETGGMNDVLYRLYSLTVG